MYLEVGTFGAFEGYLFLGEKWMEGIEVALQPM